MRRSEGLLGVVLAVGMCGLTAWAQAAGAPPTKQTGWPVRTFYLTNAANDRVASEITTAVRNMVDPSDKVYLVPSQNALILQAPPEQMELVQKLISDLDRPKKAYRVLYTATEMDGGKRVGTQHFAMIVIAGGRTTLKQGSKIPVVTGTNEPANGGAKTMVTYLDVGLNVDASIDEAVDGIRLRSRVEQSGLAAETSGLGATDPIVRQMVLEGTSILAEGKPLMLGSLDVTGTTRKLDIEVMIEAVR